MIKSLKGRIDWRSAFTQVPALKQSWQMVVRRFTELYAELTQDAAQALRADVVYPTARRSA